MNGKPRLLLLLGVVAVSFSAILIRLTRSPSLVVAAWRLTLASAALIPWSLAKGRGLSRHGFLLSLLSGAFLALHFATWIESLRHTTVASSVVLVTTNPVFVGLFSLALGEAPSRALWQGIGLSTLGGVLIGWGDFALGGSALWGDFLALVGAVMASGYLLVGRRMRRHGELLPYVAVAYGTAAVLLSLLRKPSSSGQSPCALPDGGGPDAEESLATGSVEPGSFEDPGSRNFFLFPLYGPLPLFLAQVKADPATRSPVLNPKSPKAPLTRFAEPGRTRACPAPLRFAGQALLSGEKLPMRGDWLWIGLLALGPQLLGHTSFNRALRSLPASAVAVAILGEPVGAALWAYLVFGEGIGLLQGVGMVLLLVGIARALRAVRL